MKNFDSVRQIVETRVFNILIYTLTQEDVDTDEFNPVSGATGTNPGSTGTSSAYLFDGGVARIITNSGILGEGETLTAAEFQNLNPNRSGGGSYVVGDQVCC